MGRSSTSTPTRCRCRPTRFPANFPCALYWRSTVAAPGCWASSRATRSSTRSSATPDPSALESAGHAVTDGKQGEVDALVRLELGVECADGPGILVLVGGIRHGAAPQHVVDQDQAARPHQLEAAFVVAVIAALVGIDEGEIDPAGEALFQQPVERRQCRSDGELD